MPRREGRAGREGRPLRRPARRRRPGRDRRALRRRAAPTSSAFLDITASHEERPIILDVVARTAERVLHAAHGRRRRADASTTCARCCNAGADKVSINTAAVERPELVRGGGRALRRAVRGGGDRRARRAPDDPARGWEVFTHGGRTPTGLDAVEWAARMEAAGAGEILLTSMDRDGTQAGYDLALTRAVVDRVDIPVIASGGVGNARASLRGPRRGRRQRGAGGVDLPLRRRTRCARQGVPRGARRAASVQDGGAA